MTSPRQHMLKIGEKAGDDLLEGLINNVMMPEMSPNVNKQADCRCHTVTAGVTSNLQDNLEVVLSTSPGVELWASARETKWTRGRQLSTQTIDDCWGEVVQKKWNTRTHTRMHMHAQQEGGILELATMILKRIDRSCALKLTLRWEQQQQQPEHVCLWAAHSCRVWSHRDTSYTATILNSEKLKAMPGVALGGCLGLLTFLTVDLS